MTEPASPRAAVPWVWQAIWHTRACERDLGLHDRAGFCRRCSRGIGPPAELHEAAVRYGELRLLGGPSVAANFALIAFFRGLGDTRTPMRAALIAIGVNIVAAWVLIFGEFGAPRLGAAGAGFGDGRGQLHDLRAAVARAAAASGARALRHAADGGRSARRSRASCVRARRSAASGCST